MSYQATQIANILEQINKELFIPGIQRPFVWQPDQIARLFDSLMRRYPIGSFLLWRLEPGSLEDWDIYRFVDHFWQGDIHNDPANLDSTKPVTLVLDGQQRLTSILIGLKGSYAIRQKYRRKNNADAWTAFELYLDLAHAPEQDDEDEEGNPIENSYRFKFFEEAKPPTNKQDELWFEVGMILAAKSEDECDRLLRDWVDNNFTLDAERKQTARETLARLWTLVWRDESIAFFTEHSQSYDKVLDIFIRANDGGVKLSRGDLLMSVITLRWDRFSARDEIEQLLKQVSDISQPKRTLQREYVLRASLFLSDLPFSIQVKNFSPANIRRIEAQWEPLKSWLIAAATLAADQGLRGDNLASMNGVTLIAYYLRNVFEQQAINDPALGQVDPANLERIRQWMIVLGAGRYFSQQTSNKLNAARSILKTATRKDETFPIIPLMEVFGFNAREAVFGGWVDTFCAGFQSDKHSELLVSLLYGGHLPNLGRRPVNLVQPRFFMDDELRHAGVPEAQRQLLQGFADRQVLAVALTKEQLQDYYLYPFEEWLARVPDSFFVEHTLPADRDLYRLERLPELVQARRVMLDAHFRQLFLDQPSAVLPDNVRAGREFTETDQAAV